MSPRRTLALHLGLAALCLAAARPVEAGLVRMRQSAGLAAYSGTATGPGEAFVRSLGGLRGILADLIWMRALRMQDDGRYYEIVALLDGLLQMQPHFASVWVFQAHVLAFDFGSPEVEPDPAEAFRWIERGIGVLERGTVRNPASALIEERLAHIYMLKLSPASSGEEWQSQVAMLNDQLTGRGRPPSQPPPELSRLQAAQLERLAELDGRRPPAPDRYTGLRLARWHFLQATARPDVSASRKLLCERMAIRCQERMGEWAAAESAWRALYERQGREDSGGFFREFMRSVVCEQLLMGQVQESREAFARMRGYFPDTRAGYREFLIDEIRKDRAHRNEERAQQLYRALRAVEPGETRSYEEITGPVAPAGRPQPGGQEPK
jgi:hypothetical protein